ncbi:MAG: toll/interleukin-1 receptor domain-containing protein [Chitinophagaceae bacterium]
MLPSKIFLSYSRIDAEFALQLVNDLKTHGLSVWFDQMDIRSGTHFDTEIQHAIEAAHYLVVILTPTSASSNNVLDEVSYALDEGKPVIPILLADCDVPLRLKRLQYVDFTNDYTSGLNLLLYELKIKASYPAITYWQKHRKLLLTLCFVAGLLLITLIIFFGSDKMNTKNKLTPATLKDKANPYIISKPLEADNTPPEIISWHILDKITKKEFSAKTNDTSIIVDAGAELKISCTVYDPEGVKSVDLYGNASWDCKRSNGSLAFGNHQYLGKVWDYTRSDNQVITQVVTVLAFDLKKLSMDSCTDADPSLNSKTGDISIYCYAHNYNDAPKLERFNFRFLKD